MFREGGTRGLHWPRACLERSLSAATRGGADPLFRSCRGGLPLPGVSRGSLRVPGFAAFAVASAPAKAADMPVPTRRVEDLPYLLTAVSTYLLTSLQFHDQLTLRSAFTPVDLSPEVGLREDAPAAVSVSLHPSRPRTPSSAGERSPRWVGEL